MKTINFIFFSVLLSLSGNAKDPPLNVKSVQEHFYALSEKTKPYLEEKSPLKTSILEKAKPPFDPFPSIQKYFFKLKNTLEEARLRADQAPDAEISQVFDGVLNSKPVGNINPVVLSIKK